MNKTPSNEMYLILPPRFSAAWVFAIFLRVWRIPLKTGRPAIFFREKMNDSFCLSPLPQARLSAHLPARVSGNENARGIGFPPGLKSPPGTSNKLFGNNRPVISNFKNYGLLLEVKANPCLPRLFLTISKS